MSQAAGERDQRIEIQQRVAGKDAAGQPVAAWALWKRRWAAAEPLRGREYIAASQEQATVDVIFRFPFVDGVQQDDMRVMWRGAAYDIRAVIDVKGRRETLELECVKGGRDGR